MKEFFEKLKKGKEKVEKFGEESRRFQKSLPLPIMMLNDALPLMVVVAYVLLGVLGNWWHPAWILFLLIPIYYLTIECVKHKSAEAFPIVFIVTAAYLCLGCLKGLWHPYWALYALVPAYYTAIALIKGGSWAKVFDLLIPALTIAGFLLIGFLTGAWHPGWVIFFVIPLYYSFKGSIKKYSYQQKENKSDPVYHISAEDIEDKPEDKDEEE